MSRTPASANDRQTVFRDLRARNERRARIARKMQPQREHLQKVDRVVQLQREFRLRGAG